jgi:hypothetical protein
MATAPDSAELLSQLHAREELASRLASRNWRLGFYMTIVAIMATSAAAGSAASSAPPWVMSVLAVFPSALLLFLRGARFEQRCKWWRRQQHGVGLIERALKNEGLEVSEASRMFSQLLCEMEGSYPGFLQVDGRSDDKAQPDEDRPRP